MIDHDAAHILARLLIAIFGKKRPSSAYAVFVSLIALVCAVFIVQAKSVDDAMFPVIALVFTLAYIIIDAIEIIRRNSIRDFHSIEEEIQFEDDV
jgi:hypothetical protein